MFFKSGKRNKWIALGLIGVCGMGLAPVRAQAYVATSRDTKTVPERAEYEPEDYEEYELLLETGNITGGRTGTSLPSWISRPDTM